MRSAPSEQVEQQVTRKLEEYIFKFPEVRKQKTYSTSRPGLVTIKVELKENVKDADQFWAKLRLELLETALTELPAGVRGPIVNSDFGDTVAMLLAIHGKRYGYRELRDYVDRIQDELRGVRNVGKVATYGEQSEQIWITSSLEGCRNTSPIRSASCSPCSSATSSKAPVTWKPARRRFPFAPPGSSPPKTRSEACWWMFRARAGRFRVVVPRAGRRLAVIAMATAPGGDSAPRRAPAAPSRRRRRGRRKAPALTKTR